MARRRIFLTFTALAVMAMILFFSTQNSRASEQTSGYLVDWLIDRFLPQFDVWPLARQLQTHQAWQFVVRKCAHFTEYALLGLALTPLVHSYGARRGCCWELAAGDGAGLRWTRRAVPGRNPQRRGATTSCSTASGRCAARGYGCCCAGCGAIDEERGSPLCPPCALARGYIARRRNLAAGFKRRGRWPAYERQA